MNFILYIHRNASTKGETLKKIIDQNSKGIEIQTLQTFNAFKARVKQVSAYNNEIFILLADSKKRLNKLTTLIDLLENKRIVLILPDESKETISVALQFIPRYFTFINDTYDDLCAVISKMANKKKGNTT